MHGNAKPVQSLGNRVHYRGAHSASDAQSTAGRNQFRGLTQWSGNSSDGLAWFEGNQVARTLSYGLDDQGNGAGRGIGIGNGQRDALSVFSAINNDELTRLPDLRNARRGELVES